MSEGQDASSYQFCKDVNHMVIVLLGKNKNNAELLRTLILSNENLTENNTSLGGEICGMQVSVIDATDISAKADGMDDKLAADWKSALSPDAQYLFALVLVAENGKLLPEDKSTFAQVKAMFKEHAEKNMVLAVFSMGDVEKLCEEDDTMLGQMLDKGRYFVFNENSKSNDLMEKLRDLRECRAHTAAPPLSNKEQTREEQKTKKSETEATVITKGPAMQDPAINELQNQRVEEASTMTIVLLGQSGSGKSASGNTILGKQVFKSYLSSVPITTQCQTEDAQIFGIPVRVIDTPDFFSEDVENRAKATATCRRLCSAGNVVYLLVMQLGRFTDGERQILPQIQDEFGQEVVQKTVVLFTFKNDLKKTSLKEYIDNTDPRLQDLIKSCGSRCHAFDNNDKNSKQVIALFNIIVDMQKEYLNVAEVYPEYKNKSEKKGCTIL